MIFAIKGYQEFNNSNVPNWNDWVDMLNKDILFCSQMSIDQRNDFPETLNPVNLPSYHPYWRFKVEKNYYQTYLMHVEKRLKCLKDASLIKTEYSNSTTMAMINSKVESARLKCENYSKTLN